jgi:hypothetical protein
MGEKYVYESEGHWREAALAQIEKLELAIEATIQMWEEVANQQPSSTP